MPQLEVIPGHNFKFVDKAFNSIDYLLDEDLEDRVRACKALAVDFALLPDAVEVPFQDHLGHVSLFLVHLGSSFEAGGTLRDVVVSLLGQDVVLILNYIIDVG